MPRKALRDPFRLANSAGLTLLGKAILDKVDRGIVLLDSSGSLVDANTSAQEILRNGDGIHVRAGRFGFDDPDLDARMTRLVAAAGRSGGNGSSTIAARIKRTHATAYRIVVTAISARQEPPVVAFLALIYGLSEPRDISDAVLRELYGLTRAQSAVARRLHAGRSVEETASDLALSLNTVRTHLKQIFFRCEVQSQAELMHMLALGPHSF